MEDTAKLTPNNVDQQTPNTQVPIQQSPFGQAQPVEPQAAPVVPPVAPIAPAQPVTTTPDPTASAPVQPQAAPQPPVAPVQPQAPVAPIAPVQPPIQQPGGLNTSQSMQPQPTEPAFTLPVRERVQANYMENATDKNHWMKPILDAQPKVQVYIPLIQGEKPGTLHPVGINGYFVYVPKGKSVKVPESVADQIENMYTQDYENGADIDLSKNEDKQRALA